MSLITQNFIHDLALRLSYAKGKDEINQYIRVHKLLFSGIVVILSCVLLWPRMYWPYASRWTIVASIIVGSLFSMPTLTWIIETGGTSRRLLKAAIACGTPLLVGILLTFSMGAVVLQAGHKLAPLALPNITAYAITASVAATTVPALGLALWLAIISTCVILLSLGSMTVWRIAEYNKGAWAGLMALVGVVPTIVAVFVNRK